MTDFSVYKGKRCLVTGGTGMIGREVVRQLCDVGARVRSVSLDNLSLDHRALYYHGDLTDFSECKWFCWGIDYVFHVAGIKSNARITLERPASFFVPLLRMNTNLLEAARISGVSKLVYVSSIGAYDRQWFLGPDASLKESKDLYQPADEFPGWAKRMGEYQCQAFRIQYGLDWAVVRPSNCFGLGDNFDPETAMVVPALMGKAVRGDDPVRVWGSPANSRDFLYADDAARGILLAGLHSTYTDDGIGFVNLGGREECSIGQLVQYLREITFCRFEFDETKHYGFSRRVLDIHRAKQLLGWEPKVPFRIALEKTWTWFLEHRDEYAHKQNYFKLAER